MPAMAGGENLSQNPNKLECGCLLLTDAERVFLLMPDSSHLHDDLLTTLYTVRTQNARSSLPEGSSTYLGS